MSFLADFFAYRRKVTAERADVADRVAIAKAFNDRYTYRAKYEPKANMPAKPEVGKDLRDWFPDQAWMCPKCNAIHRSTGHSVWTGLHFPACCDHPADHRLCDTIRMPRA